MTPLILGGTGILGRSLTEYFQKKNISVTSFSHSQLDISNQERVVQEIERFRPTIIYNAAAMTNVDLCETEKEKAFEINAQAPARIAEFCKKQNISFVHVSTDYVFDGAQRVPYRETNDAAPLGIYAASKVEGEKCVLKENPQALVVRVAWVFRPGGKTFLCRLRDLVMEKESLEVANDRIGCCTYGMDAAMALETLVQKKCSGLVHFTNEGDLSWYDFASALLEKARELKMNPQCKQIAPISSAGLKLLVKRPDYSVLDKSLYCQLTGEKIRHWRETLSDFLCEKI